MRKLMTLCIVYDDGRVLLGMKKRGFGEGRWNGFGGKVEHGESIEDAVRRELHEEAGIVPLHMKQYGLIDFSFADDPEKVLEVHVYGVSSFSGVPRESEEMRPQWFRHEEIPYDAMWVDDRYWLPTLLGGNCFKGSFHFNNKDEMTILRYELEQVDRKALNPAFSK